MSKKVQEVKFILKTQDAENLWGLLSNAEGAKLDSDAGVPFKLYELRCTLDKLRQEPDDDEGYDLISTTRGIMSPPKRQAYCKKYNLSINYFPEEAKIEWVIRKSLLKILKLVLKSAVAATTGESFANLVKLCKTLRLSAWFRANFNKVVTVDLGEDDRDLDDELDPEDLKEDEEDEEEDEDKEKENKDEENKDEENLPGDVKNVGTTDV